MNHAGCHILDARNHNVLAIVKATKPDYIF